MYKGITVCVCLCLLAGVLSGCAKGKPDGSASPPGETSLATLTPTSTPRPIKNPEGSTVSARFNPPPGYTRMTPEEGSFGAFLQNLPLKEDGAPVLLHDGAERPDAPQAAVLGVDISKTSQQQGPRALVRLRAEYLFQSGQTGRINYHFLSGFAFSFSKWGEGYRVKVDGKSVEWVQKADPGADHGTLLAYLNTLFVYSNTTSLKAELRPVSDPQLGDIFINSNSGAVMIVDMAKSDADGEILFLLAQSPSPTQEIYILKNNTNLAISPWYSGAALSPLTTPDGEFTPEDLGRFDEELTLDS